MDRAPGHDRGVPVTGRFRRRLAAAAAVVLGVGWLALTGLPASADSACSSFAATAAGDAVRVVASPDRLGPGINPDAASPSAQASADSLGNSAGFAGVAYSDTVVGNAGLAGIDAGSATPLIVTSSYPAKPLPDERTSPAGVASSKSEERSSTATATSGGPGSGQAVVANVTARAAAGCAANGTISAESSSEVVGADFSGLLRMASVRSAMVAQIDPTGTLTLTPTLVFDGVTVAGQAVQITDKGLVIAGSPIPLPANPETDALKAVGITVRYIAASTDPDGQGMVAPGVEVAVAEPIPGGNGTGTVTYTFGRSYARVSGTPDAGPPPTFAVAPPTAPSSSALSRLGSAPGTAPATAPPARQQVAGQTRASTAPLPGASIANVSMASVYPALGFGAVVLAAGLGLFRMMGVKLRWT